MDYLSRLDTIITFQSCGVPNACVCSKCYSFSHRQAFKFERSIVKLDILGSCFRFSNDWAFITVANQWWYNDHAKFTNQNRHPDIFYHLVNLKLAPASNFQTIFGHLAKNVHFRKSFFSKYFENGFFSNAFSYIFISKKLRFSSENVREIDELWF